MQLHHAIDELSLSFLTTLPMTIATYIAQQAPMATVPLPRMQLPPVIEETREPAGSARVPGASNQQEITHPKWNQNLKSAWTTLGAGGLYAVGSPFRDKDQPNKKCRIPSDTPGVQICLAMAMKDTWYTNYNGLHQPLNKSKVQQVAQAGHLNVE
jgi:hypothetical protein